MESTENDIQGEKVVMQKVIMNLQNYTQMMKRHVNRMKHNFDVLSDQHKKFLAHRKNLHDEIESGVINIFQIIRTFRIFFHFHMKIYYSKKYREKTK